MGNGALKLVRDTTVSPKSTKYGYWWESFDPECRGDIIKLINDANELKDSGKITDELYLFVLKTVIYNIISREVDTHFSDYIARRFYPKVNEIVDRAAL
ncbi:MAG: hypothetical protein JW837_16405 [Sedimentisphaerales bacterium]|nr:hypothetical protein [Sedimentisphaerales bacterium]